MKNENELTPSQPNDLNTVLCEGRANTNLSLNDFVDLGFSLINNPVESDEMWSFSKSFLNGVYTVELIYTNDHRSRLEVRVREKGMDGFEMPCEGIVINTVEELKWFINHLFFFKRLNYSV